MKKINLCELANIFQAYLSCKNSTNKIQSQFIKIHESKLEQLFERLPHGSGLDSGVKFNFEESNKNRLVFDLSFHHMDENGFYDGWTDHNLIITPSFLFGYDMKLTGINKRDIKTYLYDLFSEVFEFVPDYMITATTSI